jgi:adenylate kinase family enzyme
MVVLGNGASGKSLFARELREATGVERTELDSVFW